MFDEFLNLGILNTMKNKENSLKEKDLIYAPQLNNQFLTLILKDVLCFVRLLPTGLRWKL